MWFLFYHCKRRAVNNILLWNIVLERDIVYGKYEMREAMYVQENRKYPQNISFMRHQFFFIARMIVARAPSQYKDRLIYVWRFPC